MRTEFASNARRKGKGMVERRSDLEPIEEGEGRFPWWIWVVIVLWLVYAFVIAPFEVTRP